MTTTNAAGTNPTAPTLPIQSTAPVEVPSSGITPSASAELFEIHQEAAKAKAAAAAVIRNTADLDDQRWLNQKVAEIENGIEAVLDIARNWTDGFNLTRLHPGVSAQDYILARVKHPLGRGVVVPLLAESNWSNRQIAAVAGVSPDTVDRTARIQAVDRPAETLGADGKLRPAHVVREVKAEVIEADETTPESAPGWHALVLIIGAIEDLMKTDADALAASVPATRQASTAKKLVKVVDYLHSIRYKLDRMTAPSPEEEQARAALSAAARPEKACTELDVPADGTVTT